MADQQIQERVPPQPISPKMRDLLDKDLEGAEVFPEINPPFQRKKQPMENIDDFEDHDCYDIPKVFSMPEMTPQIMPTRTQHLKHVPSSTLFDKTTTYNKLLAEKQLQHSRLIPKKKKTAEELRREAEVKKAVLMGQTLAEREKGFKWRKQPFTQATRKDRLALKHYRHRSEHVDRINRYFTRFNSKANVITYASSEEYFAAKIDQLPSSTSWTKEETDCLMYLCQKFDLRFLVIADRFAKFLKDRYDRRQIESLQAFRELPVIEFSFVDNERDKDKGSQIQDGDEAALVSNQLSLLGNRMLRAKSRLKKRDLKFLDKQIFINQMDENVFDKTVEEIKFRYYDVARAILTFRRDYKHPLLKNFDPFDIEYETTRKCNWERVFSRGKESFHREKDLIDDHLKLEAQIRRIEKQDFKKQALVAKMAGIKVPLAIECTLIDPKQQNIPLSKEQQVDEEFYGLNHPNVQDKVGLPLANQANSKEILRTSGAYFMSNELNQDVPLPEDLQQGLKMFLEVLEVKPSKLTPSLQISNKLHEIYEQIMINFQLENMVNDRKDDLEILLEREEQIKELVNAHTQEQKQDFKEQYERSIKRASLEAGLMEEAEKAGIINRTKDKKQQNDEDLAICTKIGYTINQYNQKIQSYGVMRMPMGSHGQPGNLALLGTGPQNQHQFHQHLQQQMQHQSQNLDSNMAAVHHHNAAAAQLMATAQAHQLASQVQGHHAGVNYPGSSLGAATQGGQNPGSSRQTQQPGGAPNGSKDPQHYLQAAQVPGGAMPPGSQGYGQMGRSANQQMEEKKKGEQGQAQERRRDGGEKYGKGQTGQSGGEGGQRDVKKSIEEQQQQQQTLQQQQMMALHVQQLEKLKIKILEYQEQVRLIDDKIVQKTEEAKKVQKENPQSSKIPAYYQQIQQLSTQRHEFHEYLLRMQVQYQQRMQIQMSQPFLNNMGQLMMQQNPMIAAAAQQQQLQNQQLQPGQHPGQGVSHHQAGLPPGQAVLGKNPSAPQGVSGTQNPAAPSGGQDASGAQAKGPVAEHGGGGQAGAGQQKEQQIVQQQPNAGQQEGNEGGQNNQSMMPPDEAVDPGLADSQQKPKISRGRKKGTKGATKGKVAAGDKTDAKGGAQQTDLSIAQSVSQSEAPNESTHQQNIAGNLQQQQSAVSGPKKKRANRGAGALSKEKAAAANQGAGGKPDETGQAGYDQGGIQGHTPRKLANSQIDGTADDGQIHLTSHREKESKMKMPGPDLQLPGNTSAPKQKQPYQKRERGAGKRGPNKNNPQSSRAESQIGETNSADQSIGIGQSGAPSVHQDYNMDAHQAQMAAAAGDDPKIPSGGGIPGPKRGLSNLPTERQTKGSRGKNAAVAGEERSTTTTRHGNKTKENRRKHQSQEIKDEIMDPSQVQSVDQNDPDQQSNQVTPQSNKKGTKGGRGGPKNSDKKQRNTSSQQTRQVGGAAAASQAQPVAPGPGAMGAPANNSQQSQLNAGGSSQPTSSIALNQKNSKQKSPAIAPLVPAEGAHLQEGAQKDQLSQQNNYNIAIDPNQKGDKSSVA